MKRTHGATVDELASGAAPPVIVQRVPRRVEHIWTPDGLFTFEQRGAFPPIIALGAEFYRARTNRDNTIAVHVGRFSGAEFVDYFPYRDPKPTRDQNVDYRAALALERQHGERVDQSLSRSGETTERERTRTAHERRARERARARASVPPVRGR